LGIQFSEQVRFPDCRYKRSLPFDFFIQDKILLEYDGIQHFSPVPFRRTRNNVNYVKAEKAFSLQKEKDAIKTQFCKNKNITLYRISYLENIQDCLNEILKREGIK